MIALAFKRGQGWYSNDIYKATGGAFSHVELIPNLDSTYAAECYSSREPTGTGFDMINLSDPAIWQVVPLPDVFSGRESDVLWYCRGSSGRRYDYRGIVGIGLDKSDWHDGAARFCSEEVTTVLQHVLGMFPSLKPWMVAPSGFGRGDGRYGLYELVSGKQKVG